MKEYNKLEIIGFSLLVIGALFWLSEKFYIVESMASIYGYTRIALSLGLAIWAIGYMQKEKVAKDKMNKN